MRRPSYVEDISFSSKDAPLRTADTSAEGLRKLAGETELRAFMTT
jgi:hypothetical protein